MKKDKKRDEKKIKRWYNEFIVVKGKMVCYLEKMSISII